MSDTAPDKPTTSTVCPERGWENFRYMTDNGPVISTFYTEADTLDEDAFPNCARIIIPIKEPSSNGMPGNEEAKVLWALEDELVEILDSNSVKCRLVGRLTHSNTRELVFQVSDWEEFRPPVGFWLGEHPEYDMDVSEHEGWSFFWDSVWPSEQSWMWISDRRVVDSLIESGSNPSLPHSLEFVFVGAEGKLAELKALLEQRGYTLIDLDKEEQRLVMAFLTPLDLDAIFTESLYHSKVTEELGLEYDGWGALSVN